MRWIVENKWFLVDKFLGKEYEKRWKHIHFRGRKFQTVLKFQTWHSVSGLEISSPAFHVWRIPRISKEFFGRFFLRVEKWIDTIFYFFHRIFVYSNYSKHVISIWSRSIPAKYFSGLSFKGTAHIISSGLC